jgi:hypothetical protein
MAVKSLVATQKPPIQTRLDAADFYLRLAAKAMKVPPAKTRKLPKDGAANHDAYLAGE